MSEIYRFAAIGTATALALGGCAAKANEEPVSGSMTELVSVATNRHNSVNLQTEKVDVSLDYINCTYEPTVVDATHYIQEALRTSDGHLENATNPEGVNKCEAIDVTLPDTAEVKIGGSAQKMIGALPGGTVLEKFTNLGTYTKSPDSFNTYQKTFTKTHLEGNFGDVDSLSSLWDKKFDTYFKTVNETMTSTVTFTDILED